MMWKEFEELAGYEVSYEDYTEIIEPMYMATKLDKRDFIACLDKKRFALKTQKELTCMMKKLAKHLYEICGHYTDWECEESLNKLAKEYATRFYGYDANELNGVWFYLEKEYEYPALGRGCTYPKSLKIMHSGNYGVNALKVLTLVAD